MTDREAKIAIMMKNGQIVIKTQIKSLSQGELGLLIGHIDLLKDDLKELFKKGLKKVET